jgi:hypothetical protein
MRFRKFMSAVWVRIPLQIICILAFFILGFFLYLSQFPLPLNGFLPLIRQSIPYPLEIKNLHLTWRAFNTPPELQMEALETVIQTPSGPLTFKVAQAYLSIHTTDLMWGHIRPKALTLIRPQWTLPNAGPSTTHLSERLNNLKPMILAALPQIPFKKITLVDPLPHVWPKLTMEMTHNPGNLFLESRDSKGFECQITLRYQDAQNPVHADMSWAHLDLQTLIPQEGMDDFLKSLLPITSGQIKADFQTAQTFQGHFEATGTTQSAFMDTLSLKGTFDQKVISLAKGTLSIREVPVRLQGVYTLSDHPSYMFTASTQNVPVETLPSLWPSHLAVEARSWIVRNIPKGLIHKAKIHLSGHQGPDGWSSPACRGVLHLSDLQLSFLEGMPPITKMNAKADFTHKHFDITVLSGVLEDLIIQKGRVEITGLDQIDQDLKTTLSFHGSLPHLLKTLSHKPLEYTQEIGLPAELFTGTTANTLELQFPLTKDLTLTQVDLKATSKLTDVACAFPLGDSVLPFKKGSLTLETTTKKLNLIGEAKLFDKPVTFGWSEVFAHKKSRELSLEIQVTRDLLKSWNIDLAPSLIGTFPLRVTYSPQQKNPLKAEADFTQASLDIPALSWSKKAGVKATLSIGETDQGFALPKSFRQGITLPHMNFKSESLNIQGLLALSSKWQIERLELPRIQNAANDCALVMIRKPQELSLALSGRKATLSWLLKPESTPSESLLSPGDRLKISLSLDDVFLGGKAPLHNAQGSLTAVQNPDGLRIETILLGGKLFQNRPKATQKTPAQETKGRASEGTFFLQLSSKSPERHFALETDNAGRLMRSLGLMSNLRGGQLSITATEKTSTDLFEGEIHMGSFTIVETPFLSQLFMTLTSPTSFLSLFSGGKSQFSSFEGRFILSPDLLRLRKCRMQNMSTGVTFYGRINRKEKTLSLKGNLIPLYWLNKPLSMIPFIGNLLTGGEDDGFAASRFYVTGPLDAPSLSVNPFQMLTPGPFKQIFRSLEKDSRKDA